jgi:hypothetical protein
MSTQKNASIKWILSIMFLAIASLSFAWVYTQDESVPEVKINKEIIIGDEVSIDEKSKKIMTDMSNYLVNLKEFSFQSKGYFEAIDSATGKKEKINNSGELSMKRPNKIKVRRTGEKADLEFFCDGKQATMYGKKSKSYSSAPVTGNLDEIFDNLSERFNISLPAADLLYTDVYQGLMQDVVSGKYMGKEKVADVSCDHLAFTGKEVDWQIWVEDGDKKLPRKYVITSKQIEGKPESSIEISEWKTDVKLEDKMFAFAPPQGAKKIEFLQLKNEIQAKKK